MRVLLLLTAACAALVLAGSAGAGQQSYMDSTGEVPGSADVSGVSVTNDLNAGTITFQVQTNWPAWDPNTFFAILVDSDQNASTGTAGFDYVVTGDRFGGTVVNTVNPLVVPATSSLGNGLWTVTARTSDLGNPQAISFFVLTEVGQDQLHPFTDRAPDNGTWSYSLVPPPPPPPPPAPTPPPAPVQPDVLSAAGTWAGKPTHGRLFHVGMTMALSDGTVAKARKVTCRASLGGKTFARSCTFRVPKAAKGRRLVVKMAGTYAGQSYARTYGFRVG